MKYNNLMSLIEPMAYNLRLFTSATTVLAVNESIYFSMNETIFFQIYV